MNCIFTLNFGRKVTSSSLKWTKSFFFFFFFFFLSFFWSVSCSCLSLFSRSIWFSISLLKFSSFLLTFSYTSSFISLFETLSSSSLSSLQSSELEYSYSLWTLPETHLLPLLAGSISGVPEDFCCVVFIRWHRWHL